MRTLVLVTLLATSLATCGLADLTVTDHGFTGWWSIGGDVKAQGIAFDVDSTFKLGDLPLIEKVNYLGLNLDQIPFYYDFLAGATDEGQVGLLGIGLSLNVGANGFKAKAGVALYTNGKAGLYVGIGLKF